MKIRMTIATALVLSVLPFSVNSVNAAAVCNSPSMRADVSVPSIMRITGSDISRAALAELWRITTATEDATVTFGKVIAQDQNWLGACEYPGIGLGAGSGLTLDQRAVTFWIWSTGVDLAAARLSIYQLIGQIAVTTTSTSTTSTTVALSTEEIAAPSLDTTTTLPLIDISATTTTITTTTVAEPSAVARTVSAIQPPVKASLVKIAVQKKKIVKVTAKKKKVVTIEVTKGKKKKK